MARVHSGLENFIAHPPAWTRGRRLGLVCNPASVDADLNHARDLIAARFGDRLTALYSPQHGFHAEKQDNMIESDDLCDPVLGLPVFSLYAETRIPTEAMLRHVDVLLVDLQDVGTRVYTFVYTLSYCMQAARRYGKKVVVLDRPNPVGGHRIEGNCLRPQWSSFVGRYPLPMRHAMTIGELAGLFNRAYGIQCDLTVIPLEGWQREMSFEDTGLPWVPPSPNLPTPASTAVYPGQVIWEGTNVSEGRGTTQPFELWGAPFVDPHGILEVLAKNSPPPGVLLRPAAFEPTSGKWQGQCCHGFQIHIRDRSVYQPYRTSLELLQAVLRRHGPALEWKPPPYEYEHHRLPLDLILGDRNVRLQIERLVPMDEIVAAWQPELERFAQISRQMRLYE